MEKVVEKSKNNKIEKKEIKNSKSYKKNTKNEKKQKKSGDNDTMHLVCLSLGILILYVGIFFIIGYIVDAQCMGSIEDGKMTDIEYINKLCSFWFTAKAHIFAMLKEVKSILSR